MTLPNFAASHWLDIVNASDISTTRWNDLKNDIKDTIQEIDADNVTDGGLLPADVDGSAMTLDDGSIGGNAGQQTVTRDSKFMGRLFRSGALYDPTVLMWDTVADTTPNVTGLYSIMIDNKTGGAVTVTGLDGGEDGQIIQLTGIAVDDDLTLEHGTDLGDFYLDGKVNATLSSAGAGRAGVWRFIYTDMNGRLANKVWWEISNTNIQF